MYLQPIPSKFPAFFLVVVFCFFISCKKSGTKPDGNKDDESSQAEKPVDVYITGVNDSYATVWKNGIATQLPSGISGSMGTDIVVNGNDVYVAGVFSSINQRNEIFTQAVYWKNGVPVMLPVDDKENFGSGASAIAIYKNDIYIVGYYYYNYSKFVACYWKNGQRTDLAPNTITSSATDIVIVDGNVYISGHTESEKIRNTAVYWRNGILHKLPMYVNEARATAIAVDADKNIYVAGYDGEILDDPNMSVRVPTIWKNNKKIDLIDKNLSIYFTGIALQGNDVFTSGALQQSIRPQATYSKNGNVKILTELNTYSYASAIALNNNDVYLIGISNIDGRDFFTEHATYWKNGEFIQLSTKQSRALGIAIVPQ